MRRAAALFVFTVLVAPFTALSAEPSLDSVCVGSTGNPSGTALFAESDDKSVMENFLKKRVLCPSACYDIKLVIDTKDKKLRITVSAEDKCSTPKPDAAKIKSVFSPLEKPNEKRSCNAGKGLPSVTAITLPLDAGSLFFGNMFGYEIPAAFSKPVTVGPKSRCDQGAANGVITAFTSNGRGGLDVGLQQLAKLPAPSAPPITIPDTKTAPEPTLAAIPPDDTKVAEAAKTDSDALAQVLQDKYGVPADQAKTLVESDADKIKAMIEKSMNNDKEGATAIAKELKLNDDVIKNIATMEAPKRMTSDEAKAIYEAQQQQRLTTSFTEKPPIEKAKQAIANIESSGGRYDLLGPVNPRNGDRPYGKYQVMGANVGPWTQEALGYRLTPEQFRADPQAQEKVFEYKFQQYADRYGGYENAARVWIGGVGGLTNGSARDSLGTSVDRYAQRFSQYFASGEVVGGSTRTGSGYYQSPFNGFTGGTNQIMAAGGSPFADASLFNFDQSGYGNASYGYTGYSSGPGGGGSLFSQLISYFTPRPQRPVSQQVYYPVQSTQGVITIIAQPQQAFVGNSIVVSWSSVGMRPDAPCTTLMLSPSATTTIGSSNEGSRVITARSAGILRFVSYCNSLSGAAVSNATAVAVQ